MNCFTCSLEKGGIFAKFVIIDDGWQTVDMDASGVAYESDSAAKYNNIKKSYTTSDFLLSKASLNFSSVFS